MKPQVHKANGQTEKFSKQKLMRSSLNAGAPRELAKQIAKEIEERIQKEKLTTKQIYKHTAKKLQEKNIPAACKYQLRQAIMELGPSGFPFETYIAQILQEQGYKTQTGIILQGKATTQEVDVLAEKKGEKTMIECKYHNKTGTKTDTKVTMYTHARYLDLHNNKQNNITKEWLVTNTKCTNHAIEYAQGVGLTIIGWNQTTTNKTLQEIIEEQGLYPITLFKGVKGKTKEKLLQKKIVFAKQLQEKNLETIQKQTGIQKTQLQKIIQQTKQVCKIE